MNNIYCIADIHGCYDKLIALVNKISPGKDDTLVFLGDYIDRGLQSCEVVEQLIAWRKENSHWRFLYGNHEDIFRDFLAGGSKYGQYCWFANGGRKTWESYGGHFGKVVESVYTTSWEAPVSPDFPKEHLDFLFKKTEYLVELGNYVFVHAGLVPGVSIEENKNYPDTLIWARDGFIESDFDWGKKVIFGHTPDYSGKWGKPFSPIVMKNKVGIDTACCPPNNGGLTAIKLPSEEIIQV
jgi:serine/threonine protein phosphatase 1